MYTKSQCVKMPDSDPRYRAMSSEYSFCSEGGFDELSSSSDSGFDVSFESPKHEVPTDTLFAPVKEEKRKKTRNTRCKSPTQVSQLSSSETESFKSCSNEQMFSTALKLPTFHFK